MLISRRKEGETLLIGSEIEIRIVSIRKKKVIFGVVAPRDMKIQVGKLSPEAFANTAAAVHSAELGKFLQPGEGEHAKAVSLKAEIPERNGR